MSEIKIGTRVRARYPNERWGEGEVIVEDPNPDFKPYVVRRDDGQIGYFFAFDLEVVEDETTAH